MRWLAGLLLLTACAPHEIEVGYQRDFMGDAHAHGSTLSYEDTDALFVAAVWHIRPTPVVITRAAPALRVGPNALVNPAVPSIRLSSPDVAVSKTSETPPRSPLPDPSTSIEDPETGTDHTDNTVVQEIEEAAGAFDSLTPTTRWVLALLAVAVIIALLVLSWIFRGPIGGKLRSWLPGNGTPPS